MKRPLCSVLMPVYNAERYVGEAVRSIVEQTCRDWEFVIIDDGSTDRSSEILRECAADEPRIRLIRHPNTGYLRALNEGLGFVQGEYLARMDADDVALPERLERQIAFLAAHPEYVAVGSSLLRIDADGDVLCEEPMPEGHEEIEARLLAGLGALGHPAVTMRRAAVIELGGYREAYYGAEDHDLWLRLAERGRLANLPEALLKSRVHAENFTFVHAERARAAVRAAVADACRRRGQPCPTDRPIGSAPPQSDVDRMRAWTRSALYAGHYRTGRKHALAIWRAQPGEADSWVLLIHALLGRGAAPVRAVYRWLTRRAGRPH